MLLDFDDYRPETPRITSPITVREGILLSLVVHLLFVIGLLVAPDSWFEPSPEQLAAAELLEQRQQEHMRFVEVMPLRDVPAPPKRPADASDMDRRAATPERSLRPENTAPVSRGNTPDPVVGGPTQPPSPPPGTPEPQAATPPAPQDVPLPDTTRQAMSSAPRPSQQASARQPPGNFGDVFRNPERYLRNESFDNSQGGDTEQAADIQFDSMGVDFGPWLLFFKHQVERNWTVPPAVQSFPGRVVIRFGVLRNGTLINLTILQPGPIQALTQSALSALKLSNPTAPLPKEYPVEPAIITVTFRYEVRLNSR